MRARLTIAIGLIALAASGCGDDASGRSASGEEGARAALVAFSDAFLGAKYDGACDVLTARARKKIAQIKPCPEALKLTRDLIEDEELKRLRETTRTVKITVDGDKAKVDSITADPARKSNLVRVDGRWFVDADSP